MPPQSHLGCPVLKKYKYSQKNLDPADTQQYSVFPGKLNVLMNLALPPPLLFCLSLFSISFLFKVTSYDEKKSEVYVFQKHCMWHFHFQKKTVGVG